VTTRLFSLRDSLRRPSLSTSIVLGLLLASVVINTLSIRGKSFTYDESKHLRYGLQILRGDATRFDDSKMPVSALNALPARIADFLPANSIRRQLADETTGRLATIFVAVLLAIYIFKWSRELYGTAAGLLSLTLFVFDPNIIAHSRLITTDLYALLTISLAIYYFWRFLNSPTGRHALVAALFLGIAQLAKYTAISLFPIFVAIVVVRHLRFRNQSAGYALRQYPRRVFVFLGYAALFVGVSLLVINVGFLFTETFTPLNGYQFRSTAFQDLQARLAFIHPLYIPAPYPYLEGLDWVLFHERTGGGFPNIYLLGELRYGEGFPGYYFVASALKVPLGTLAIIAAAAGLAIVRKRDLHWRANEVFLLVPVLFFVVYFNFLFRGQAGIRFFLVVFPLIYVLCGGLLKNGWQEVSRVGRAALVLTVTAVVASTLSYWPHYIPYFNEIVYDRKMAYKYLADSNLDWGQGENGLEEYIAKADQAVIIEPELPVAGRIIVSANFLVGLFDEENGRWLRENFEPVDHVGYSHLIFDISEEQVLQLKQSVEGAVR
jgi:hypothetical protein